MKPHQKNFTLWIVIFLMLAVVAKVISQGKTNYKKIQYREFAQAVESGHVKEVTIKLKSNTIIGQFKEGYDNQTRFRTTGDTSDYTLNMLRKNYYLTIKNINLFYIRFLCIASFISPC